MRHAAAATLLAVIISGFGCRAQPPEVAVTGVRVDEATEQGSRVVFSLALRNPGADPLPIRRTHYTLEVDGRPFTFTDLAVATMPAEGVQTLSFPAAFSVPRERIAGASYRLSGAVVYEPPGELRDLLTDSRVPLPSVSFSDSGRLADVPPASPSPQER